VTSASSAAAALAYDLAFLPLTAEHFDLVILAGHESTREVQALLKALSSAWLLDQLASVPATTRPGADRGRAPPAKAALAALASTFVTSVIGVLTFTVLAAYHHEPH
jgi:hypothetical protein